MARPYWDPSLKDLFRDGKAFGPDFRGGTDGENPIPALNAPNIPPVLTRLQGFVSRIAGAWTATKSKSTPNLRLYCNEASGLNRSWIAADLRASLRESPCARGRVGPA